MRTNFAPQDRPTMKSIRYTGISDVSPSEQWPSMPNSFETSRPRFIEWSETILSRANAMHQPVRGRNVCCSGELASDGKVPFARGGEAVRRRRIRFTCGAARFE